MLYISINPNIEITNSKKVSRFLFDTSNLFRASLICLVFLFINFLCTFSVHASTDPTSATVSATARVPSATPTTGDTTAPLAVVLVAPPDGQTTNNSRPEFSWKKTTDPNSNYLYYTLYLNGHATYLGISNTGNSQQYNYISHQNDGVLYLNPTLDLSPGTYTWYVKATDGSGNSSYSTTWSFVIDQSPPPLVVVNIDDQYSYPTIIEGATFELTHDNKVSLVFATESYATVSLTIITSTNTSSAYSLPTTQSGLATLSLPLTLGTYQVIATSFDQAGLTTTLPSFYLIVTSPLTGLTIPKELLPIPDSILRFPPSLPSLPATVSQISSDNQIAIYVLILLALIAFGLLMLIWNRRPNILIIDKTTGRPYRSLILYHSRPTDSARLSTSLKRIYVTSHDPILYELGNNGQAYVHHLGRYSSLTLRTPDGATHVLSLSRSQKKYFIAL